MAVILIYRNHKEFLVRGPLDSVPRYYTCWAIVCAFENAHRSWRCSRSQSVSKISSRHMRLSSN